MKAQALVRPAQSVVQMKPVLPCGEVRSLRLGRKFEGISISLEGYDFQECTFTDCEILVSEGDFSLIDNTFNHCRLTLSGRAVAVAKLIELFSSKNTRIM